MRATLPSREFDPSVPIWQDRRDGRGRYPPGRERTTLTLAARAAIPALLLLALGGRTSIPTFEDRLSRLELLKSRGTISDAEYAIMRRRLVETFDPATLQTPTDTPASLSAAPAAPADPPPDPRSLVPAPAAEPQGPSEPLSAAWVAGSWRGTHTGGSEWYWDVATTLQVSAAGDRIEWAMMRRFRSTGGVSVAEASGTVVVRDDDALELVGAYINSTQLASEGTPVRYELRRAGQALEGVALDAHTATRTLHLLRVDP
jgi:hypothetical protein